jgi:glycosyltransferase involved in cell wall biosynthesis
MSKTMSVLLILERKDRRNECEEPLFDELRRCVSVVEFDASSRWTRAIALVRIAASIFLFCPSQVHVQEQPDPLSTLLVRVFARFFPIALTIHDPVPHSGNDTVYARRNLHNQKILRALAGGFHVNGKFCRVQFLAVNPTTKPVVDTPMGVHLVPTAGQLRHANPNSLLLFGRMEAYKGVEVLLEAAGLLFKRGVAFHLVLAGKGPELDRLADKIAATPNVEVKSRYLTPSDAIGEIQAAGVVVVPYYDATQSGVISAAFANGRPVVATRVGGLELAVQPGVNGLLVPPRDATALADALETIIRSPAMWTSFADAALREAETVLSWDGVATTVLSLYDAIQEQAHSR